MAQADGSLTTASVAHTVEVAEATGVVYFLSKRFRVVSSVIHGMGMVADERDGVDVGREGCSGCLSTVISGGGPSGEEKAPR